MVTRGMFRVDIGFYIGIILGVPALLFETGERDYIRAPTTVLL